MHKRGMKLVVIVVTGLSCVAGTEFRSSAASATSAAPLQQPVISEHFTPFACSEKTTLGMLGCSEHQLLVADARINREVGVIFAVLHDNSARRRLAAAESS